MRKHLTNEISNVICCKSWMFLSTDLSLVSSFLKTTIIVDYCSSERFKKWNLQKFKVYYENFLHFQKMFYSKTAWKARNLIKLCFKFEISKWKKKLLVRFCLGAVPRVPTKWNSLPIYFQCTHFWILNSTTEQVFTEPCNFF